ncbi:hypothetical protein ES705_27256 [subsurface metagenome]
MDRKALRCLPEPIAESHVSISNYLLFGKHINVLCDEHALRLQDEPGIGDVGEEGGDGEGNPRALPGSAPRTWGNAYKQNTGISAIGISVNLESGCSPSYNPGVEPALQKSVCDTLSDRDTCPCPYDIPGMLPATSDTCGTVIRGAACSRDPTHWSRPHPVSCDRLSCQICWSRTVRKTARRVTDRFRGFLDALRLLPATLDMDRERLDALARLQRRSRRALHVIYSVHPDTYSPDTPLERLWKDARSAVKASGLLAGYIVFHPARLKEDIRYALRAHNRVLMASGESTQPFWEHVHVDALGLGNLHDYFYWSPHFHVAGIGYLVNAKTYHELTGWIYKNRRPGGIPLGIRWNAQENRFEDDIYTLFAYLLSHAAYVPGKRAVRTFGYLNPKHVKRIGDQIVKHCHEAACPACGAPVIRYWYADGIPDRPEEGIDGDHRLVVCRICGYRYEMRLI